jgi:hypothetical protein
LFLLAFGRFLGLVERQIVGFLQILELLLELLLLVGLCAKPAPWHSAGHRVQGIQNKRTNAPAEPYTNAPALLAASAPARQWRSSSYAIE